MITTILVIFLALIAGAGLATLPASYRFVLRRRGLMVVRRENFEAAVGHLNSITQKTELSGHLATVSGRKPKVVRFLDRSLASIAVHLKAAQNV